MYWLAFVGLIRSVWPVLGPFVGIGIGAYLTTRTQKQQWIRDNKRLEYRELIASLSDTTGKLVNYYRAAPLVFTGTEEERLSEMITATALVIYDRLFLAKEIAELDLVKRWQAAVTLVTKQRDPIAYGRAMDSIMDDIRRKALKEFS